MSGERTAICTLGELRELTEGLGDDVKVYVLAPSGSADDWRVVSGDVSAHLSPGPTELWVHIDESVTP